MLFSKFWNRDIIKKSKLSASETDLSGAFPKESQNDAAIVFNLLNRKIYSKVGLGTADSICAYVLLDGQTIGFPDRIYGLEEFLNLSSLTFEQKMIFHCIYSRSCDGFVREKHIQAILKEDYPDWCIPYILKLSDEYVVEILEVIYHELKDKDTDRIKMFCRLNMRSFLYGHARMISYWNEFYRDRCYYYKNYIGKKLFEECFGYTRSMEKERKRS